MYLAAWFQYPFTSQKVGGEGNDMGWGLPSVECSVGILFLSPGIFISGSVILSS